MKKLVKVITATAAMMMLTGCGTKANVKRDPITLGKDEQLVFEENYISKPFNYAEGGKFAISIISGMGSIAGGVAFDSPTAVVSGVFSILTSINDQLNGSSGPTIADVMNKLGEMDTKLDAINEKIDQNHNQLLSETVRTQAMVNQVLLEEQEQALESFNNFYSVPLENYTRDFSDYIEQSYKSYVSTDEVAEIYLSKDEKNQWTLVDVIDEGKADQTKFSLTIDNFTNSKTFLEENYNIVTVGFMDNLNKDLDNAIEDVSLPNGLDKKVCRDFIGANLVERFTQKYYKDNHQKALDLRNLVINYSKQVSGKSSKSILERYVNRLEYMYNFAGEMKTPITGILANLAHNLDVNTALAAQACLYAGVNQEEIKSEYIVARDLVKQYFEGISKMDDRYSFITNTTLASDFYRAYYNTSYTNRGNHPNFKAEFKCEKVNYEYGDVKYVEDDINSHYFVEAVDQLRIVARMNLMREIGVVKANTYLDYLVQAKVVDANAKRTYERLHDMHWISEDALRFLTGIQTRDMNDSDKNLQMECTAAGNPDGDYFNVGWKGNFRSKHGSSNWHGKMTETTYVDAKTGTIQDDKKVAAYATYSESHWYWSNDEYWSFVDNKVGNYFFILEHVA